MNIDLKEFSGFILLKSDFSIEAKKLKAFCIVNDIPFLLETNKIYLNEYHLKYIPCGSVEFCQKLLKSKVIPDYYPEWLKPYLHRTVWKGEKWLNQKVFVKPSDRYKRFNGFITHGNYKNKKKPPFWFSDIVCFENEWRYYISNGQILCGEWYAGDKIYTPKAPQFDLDIPKEYCGAVDFGMLRDGRMTLVEANHPFACGWYGNNDKLYFQWLVDGWKYMKDIGY